MNLIESKDMQQTQWKVLYTCSTNENQLKPVYDNLLHSIIVITVLMSFLPSLIAGRDPAYSGPQRWDRI